MNIGSKTLGAWVLASLTSACLASGGGVGGASNPSGSGTGQPSVYNLLYRARQNLDRTQWDEAGALLQQAYKLDAHNADVLNLLGYHTRKKPGGNAQQALQYYEQALQIDPKHRGAHEYMGEAYLTLQQPDKAQEHLLALERICSKQCEEYRDLAQALAAYAKP
jgi:tetratricopeptide (TPR) repeat protein